MLNNWKIKRIIKKLKALQSNRVNNQPTDEILKKEIAYYFELTTIYKNMRGNKKFPHAEIMYEECLRAAAALEDAEANYELGKEVLEEAKLRESLEKEGVFNSEINQKKCQQLYKEAHAYLVVAEGLNHINAKRLRGLCFINGWGVDIDKKTGFDLVVDSIEQEGAWERVPQIFAAIGLNKPEFFSEIMQHRKS